MSDITLDIMPEASKDQGKQERTHKVDAKQRIKAHVQVLEKIVSSHLINISINIDEQLTHLVYTQAIELFRGEKVEGFSLYKVPAEYFEINYKGEIYHRVKEYFFNHFALDTLIKDLTRRKVPMANYPRLVAIEFSPQSKTSFSFDVSISDMIELKEWRHFSFKVPKRKKYKDLDKQVVAFLEQEMSAAKKQASNTVEEDDWVLFSSVLLDNNNEPIQDNLLQSYFWAKVSTGALPNPFTQLFLGKHIGTHFVTNTLEADAHHSAYSGRTFFTLITVKAISKGKYLNLEHLKNIFKLKNKIEIHNKLMEVFSYRNDISQRKTIIEELFHLFLTKHRFEIPKHLVIRRQEDIINTLIHQPDYQVYRTQKDFDRNIELLAEKQLKEEILIDQIAYHENIHVDNKDFHYYLHLFNNRRLREFIYFKPVEYLEENIKLISVNVLAQTIIREKTLNFILHTLTK